MFFHFSSSPKKQNRRRNGALAPNDGSLLSNYCWLEKSGFSQRSLRPVVKVPLFESKLTSTILIGRPLAAIQQTFDVEKDFFTIAEQSAHALRRKRLERRVRDRQNHHAIVDSTSARQWCGTSPPSASPRPPWTRPSSSWWLRCLLVRRINTGLVQVDLRLVQIEANDLDLLCERHIDRHADVA